MARRFSRWISLVLCLAAALAAGATTPGNDNDDDDNDICDIAVLPAATLLLPYFEVDIDDPGAEGTLFTIANVSNLETVARVTLWTDRGYPVFSFNVYLTGYDVQTISLYDVLERGTIAPDPGTGTDIQDPGDYSDPNPALDVSACGRLPVQLEDPVIIRLQSAFVEGDIPGGCANVGGERELATGYATIDVVGNCASRTPADPAYWSTDLRYDNVLTGDFQQFHVRDHQMEGGPLVHIRADRDADFPRTFYARYQEPHRPGRDARQPLPSRFAVPWSEGTSLRVWREGRAGIGAPCEAYAADVNLAVTDAVVFDEDENGTGLADRLELPAASVTDIHDPRLPQANGASAGWLYLNLDRSRRDELASQAWVVGGIPLGNGCAPPVERGGKIAPANDNDSCDLALLPAATLLLPYFEVDLDDRNGRTTVFTVTNVSAADRIARVTLWTDYGFPVITFNVYLTGYDVQRIDLRELLDRGIVASEAGTGTRVTERGSRSRHNFALDLDGCRNLPGALSEALIVRMQYAFLEGAVPDLDAQEGCNVVGSEHDHATGYATIDVVRNCSPHGPYDAEYWTGDLAYDNVLIGDAEGAPLVHIRAMPDAGFPRTFYTRYQPAQTPHRDARQPLPSVFAARWREGGSPRFETFLNIWREGKTGRAANCPAHEHNYARFMEVVVFDEQENAVGLDAHRGRIPFFYSDLLLPSTSRTPVRDPFVFPRLDNGAVAGWLYLNLDNDPATEGATSNWVTSSIVWDEITTVNLDAAALRNGCSPATPVSEVTTGTAVIGPEGNP